MSDPAPTTPGGGGDGTGRDGASPRRRRRRIEKAYVGPLALAGIPVWHRWLWTSGVTVTPRYVPRLLANLAASLVSSLVRLPDVVCARGRRATQDAGARGARTCLVLGFHRSGTTHLHYLLAQDPRFVTPTWIQALAPTASPLSWMLLSLLTGPGLTGPRPQDDVRIGPRAPADPEFGVLATDPAASGHLGRFLCPSLDAARRHLYDWGAMSADERARWQDRFLAFVGRVRGTRPGRTLLLKSPELGDRFAAVAPSLGELRVIHIRREPKDVLRSLMGLWRALHRHGFEPPRDEREILETYAEEYRRSEAAFLRTRLLTPGVRFAEIDYATLTADPMAAVAELYDRLGWSLPEGAAVRMRRYLASVRGFRRRPNRPLPPDLPAAIDEVRRLHGAIGALDRRA